MFEIKVMIILRIYMYNLNFQISKVFVSVVSDTKFVSY